MFDVTLRCGGSSLVIGARPPYVLSSIDGVLAPVEYDITSAKYAGRHGEIVTAASFAPREMEIELTVVGDSPEEHRRRLRALLALVNPLAGTLTLQVEDRTIEVLPAATPEVSYVPPLCSTVLLSLAAYNPFFSRGAELRREVFGWDDAFEFPEEFDADFVFAERYRSGVINLHNDGDAPAPVRVVLIAAGRVVDPYIRAVGQNRGVWLRTKMLAGDQIEVVCEDGYYSVTRTRRLVAEDLIGSVDLASECYELAAGDNLFAFGAAEGETNLTAVLYYTPRYLSAI